MLGTSGLERAGAGTDRKEGIRVVDAHELVAVDRLIAELSPGTQEMIREVVLDAARRGALPAANRRVLIRMTGTSVIADVLETALAERARQPARDEPPALT